MNNSQINQLITGLRTREESEQFSGVVQLTKGTETVFAGAFGLANRSWKVENTIETRFEIASLTKLFTAVAILQIIDQKKLGFDTAVIPFLEITNTPISDDVTVAHLLTHSSGIADDAEDEAGEDYADLWKTLPNYAVTEVKDFLPNFIHKEPNFPPGKGVRYNNVAFILLGLMLEKVTSLSYRDYVYQYIFASIGMNRSGFFHMADVHEEVAESYTAVTNNQKEINGWQRPIYMRPPMGAYTTVADMTAFMLALRDGRLLSPELTQAFQTPQVNYFERDTYNTKYGYGPFFVFDKQDQLLFYLGQGEENGVSSKAVNFPNVDVTAVLLANQGFCTWPLVWEIHHLES